MSDDAQKINEAQKQIAQALAALERDTGLEVESIDIESVEVTNMNSTRQEFIRSVHIKTRVRPGVGWA